MHNQPRPSEICRQVPAGSTIVSVVSRNLQRHFLHDFTQALDFGLGVDQLLLHLLQSLLHKLNGGLLTARRGRSVTSTQPSARSARKPVVSSEGTARLSRADIFDGAGHQQHIVRGRVLLSVVVLWLKTRSCAEKNRLTTKSNVRL